MNKPLSLTQVQRMFQAIDEARTNREWHAAQRQRRQCTAGAWCELPTDPGCMYCPTHAHLGD